MSENTKEIKRKLKLQEKKLRQRENEIDALKQELHSINTKFDIFYKISSLVLSPQQNIQELFDVICELSMKAVEVEAGSILLVNLEKNILEFKSAKGEKAHLVKKLQIKIGEGIAGWVAKTGLSQIVLDVEKDPRFMVEVSKLINFPTHSILCVPLKSKDKIIGVIEMINKKGRKPFTKQDEGILLIFANQAAIALENAQLFKDEQEKVANLTTLIEICNLLTSKLNIDYVLRTIMELTSKLMKAEASSLILIDEPTQEMKFTAVWGGKEQEVKKIKLKVGEGIAGWVAKTGEPLVISDTTKDTRFYKKADEQTKFKTNSIIAVPLKIKDKIIGVVEALNRIDRESGEFKQSDIEIFSTLANQAGIAIENANLYKDLKQLFLGTIKALASAIDAKSSYTFGHSERVSKYSKVIAEELNLSEEQIEMVELAGILHDIGKIGIREEILDKPGKLTDEEYDQIKKHPVIGAEIIKPVPNLQNIIQGVLHHQERYDGRGYPDKLSGEKIPLTARILAVADTFDAMTSQRSYRDKFSDEIALREIENYAGVQFDPEVTSTFLRAYKKGKIVKFFKINNVAE